MTYPLHHDTFTRFQFSLHIYDHLKHYIHISLQSYELTVLIQFFFLKKKKKHTSISLEFLLFIISEYKLIPLK